MIILYTTFGLGNRMRVLASTVELAKRTGHKLRIYWPLENDLNAAFEDIFERNPELDVRSFSCSAKQHSLLSHLFFYGRSICFEQILVVNGNYILSRSESQLEDDFRNYKLILIRTCYELMKTYDLGILHFTNYIKERSVLSNKSSYNLVGVHIRRTDSVYSRENSATSLFVSRMNVLSSAYTDTVFYLATDDPQEKDDLQRRFGDRLLTQPISSYDRSSKDAILEAATEFFNLSRCRRILGSFGSTFSQLAARLGNSELEIITDDTQRESRSWLQASYCGASELTLNWKERVVYWLKFVKIILKNEGAY